MCHLQSFENILQSDTSHDSLSHLFIEYYPYPDRCRDRLYRYSYHFIAGIIFMHTNNHSGRSRSAGCNKETGS